MSHTSPSSLNRRTFVAAVAGAAAAAIPNNVQLRWLEEDGHVSKFRSPVGNSNGNTFDFEGRQISCEHGNRRVVRYEYNGILTVLADKFEGKPLNAPNDAVVHSADGAIWFD